MVKAARETSPILGAVNMAMVHNKRHPVSSTKVFVVTDEGAIQPFYRDIPDMGEAGVFGARQVPLRLALEGADQFHVLGHFAGGGQDFLVD